MRLGCLSFVTLCGRAKVSKSQGCLDPRALFSDALYSVGKLFQGRPATISAPVVVHNDGVKPWASDIYDTTNVKQLSDDATVSYPLVRKYVATTTTVSELKSELGDGHHDYLHHLTIECHHCL